MNKEREGGARNETNHVSPSTPQSDGPNVKGTSEFEYLTRIICITHSLSPYFWSEKVDHDTV